MNHSPERDQLPLPDYDHIPLGTLPSRIHALDAAGIEAILDYERHHGDRLPVIQVLESRLHALQEGAEPSGSLPREMPEMSQNQGGSSVSPATSGPPVNPPSQGVPTNPSQPR
ncbi:hypothetical protein M1D88_16160 [Arthrobacter sp. R1-13]